MAFYSFRWEKMAGTQLVSCSVSAHTVKADKVFVITELQSVNRTIRRRARMKKLTDSVVLKAEASVQHEHLKHNMQSLN